MSAISQARLVTVKDPGPALQAEADKRVPLGWCNVCVGIVKKALLDGEVPGPVHAAVTLVAKPELVAFPQAGGSVPAVIAVPLCWEHIGSSKASSLLQGQAGGLPG